MNLKDTLVEARDAMQAVIDDEGCREYGLFQGPYLRRHILKLDELINLLQLEESKSWSPPPCSGQWPYIINSIDPSYSFVACESAPAEHVHTDHIGISHESP